MKYVIYFLFLTPFIYLEDSNITFRKDGLTDVTLQGVSLEIAVEALLLQANGTHTLYVGENEFTVIKTPLEWIFEGESMSKQELINLIIEKI